VHGGFKEWFHKNYPSSPYVKIKSRETYSLQLAIYLTFNEWLNKRVTLANWGSGIDLTLNTISKKFTNERRMIEDEEEIRQLMTIYAINDCLAVKKLTEK
jgi:hypothetical protein